MIGRWISWLTIGLSVGLILLTSAWLFAEKCWAQWTPLSPEDAFIHGTIGLETFALKYAAVMQDLSHDSFFAEGADGSVWADYGFLLPDDIPAKTCTSNVADWAPVGIGVSSFVQAKAFQTSTKFAGLTCAACHSARLRLPDGSQTPVIHGMGNQELDVIAWSDGVKNAMLDLGLTTDAILSAYDAQCAEFDEANGQGGGVIQSLIDRIIISAWLGGIKSVIAGDLSRYDLPFDNAELRDEIAIPAGPGRTRPFRSTVRVSLNLPGADNFVLSKIPVVWEQREDLRPASQYDGSIRTPVTRSLIAAYVSGATPLALSKPEIAHNVRAAAKYTEGLGSGDGVFPRFAVYFEMADQADIEAGFQVYMEHCNDCHGHRLLDGGEWSNAGAALIHQRIPVEKLGTDPERLTFRYAQMVPLALQTDFPGVGEDLVEQVRLLEERAASARAEQRPAEAYFWLQQLDRLNKLSREYRLGHGFYFGTDDLTAETGYFNNPIPGAWLRAPYLHNASVPTMAQLINLSPRPDQFCRGNAPYDPVQMGYVAPTGDCPPDIAFSFDINAKGNSNAGHDYPWGYDDPARDPEKLRQLLAYLKTL